MKDTRDRSSDGSVDRRLNERASDDAGEGEWELVIQRPVDADAIDGLTTAIARAVADAEGIDPRDVKHPPLYEVVDTAALQEAFFGSDGANGEQIATEFRYRGFLIVVERDGWVSLYEEVE